MRGNLAYTAAALWGLAAVYVQQSQSALPDASTAAWVATAIAVLLAVQTAWLLTRRHGVSPSVWSGRRHTSGRQRRRDITERLRRPA